jgi:hypothetical protein
MSGVGSSSTLGMLDSSTHRDGLIVWNETLRRFYKNQKTLPRLSVLWILVDPSLMGGE